MKTLNKYLRLYKNILLSLCMIGITVLGVVFGLVPVVKKIEGIRKDSIELSKSIKLIRTKISLLSLEDETVYKAKLDELLAAIPNDKSLTSLFVTIDGLGVNSGTVLSDLMVARPGAIASESAKSQSNEEKKIGSNVIPFTVTVTGSYEQIYQFVSMANNVRRFFKIKNFQISFNKASAISVAMGIDAFYAPQLAPSVALETPLDPITEQEETLIAKISMMQNLGKQLPLDNLPPLIQTEPRPDPFSL